MNPERGGISTGFRAGVFFNVVLICVLGTGFAIGVAVLVRALSHRTSLRFDLNQDARYALSDEEKDLLRSIEAPVRCTFVWGYDDDILNRVLDMNRNPRYDVLEHEYRPILKEAWRRVQSILEEWTHVSPHVTFECIDFERAPADAKALARTIGKNEEEMLNLVLLQQGARTRAVPLRRMMEDMQWGSFPPMPGAQALPPRPPTGWHVHGELLTALRAVLRGEVVRIGVVAGHDAVAEPGSPTFRMLQFICESEGFALEPLDISRIESVPPSLGIVLVPAIQKRLQGREAEVLANYERSGGRLLIVADPRFPEDFSKLLEPFGTTLSPSWVEDPLNRQPQRRGTNDLQSENFCAGRHPIDAPIKGLTQIYLGPTRPLAIHASERAPGAERITLLRASKSSQLIPISFGVTGEWSEVRGRLVNCEVEPTLAAALSRPAIQGNRESRLVVIGGSGFLSPDELGLATHFGNRDLLVNAVGWLSSRPSTGVTPRDEHRARLVSVTSVYWPFFFIACTGIPVTAFLVSFLLWMRRRN